ncbi:putative serine/threonine-protein kinase [Hordeum vulgare]|nr:putative serine/threonine-protein kinase [Hordeum vulgare]
MDFSGDDGGGGMTLYLAYLPPAGRSAAMKRLHTGELREVVDPPVLDELPHVMPSVEAVTELAFRCVAPGKDDRPDAREALAELRRIQGMLSELSNHKDSSLT